MEPNRNNPPDKKPDGDKRPKGRIWVTILVTVAIVLIISGIYNMIVGSQ